jgi:excisionase family DNA binding protein
MKAPAADRSARTRPSPESAMPRTTRQPRKPKSRPPQPPAVPEADVLTLPEAAAYLRLPEGEVVRLAREQGLPGRQAGAEWRFLKSAVQDWLKAPPLPRTNKEIWASLAGAWKDDPTIDEFLKEVYRQRGRPMTEDDD